MVTCAYCCSNYDSLRASWLFLPAGAQREGTPPGTPELIPGANPTVLSSLLPPSSFTSGLPTPTKGNLGELGLQHSNGRKWFCHHIPSPLPPAPPSPTPQQNLAKALGEQDPPLGEQPPNPVWSQNLDSKPLTHEEAPSGWGGG